MATEVAPLAVGLPEKLSSDTIDYLITVITRKEPFDTGKAIRAGYEVLGFILGKFFSFSASSVRPKFKTKANPSKKAIADALAALKGGDVSAKAIDIPVWLIPVITNLITEWLKRK